MLSYSKWRGLTVRGLTLVSTARVSAYHVTKASERPRCYSTSVASKRPAPLTPADWKPKVIIFDKNGTLLSFHSMWTPTWIQNFAYRLEKSTGLCIEAELYDRLNVCRFTNKARTGLLGHGSASQIKHEVASLLQEQGCDAAEARSVTDRCWEDCDVNHPGTVKQLYNLRQMFNRIKKHGIKIAICTSDTRASTEKTLQALDLKSLVDSVRCADDVDTVAKPDPSSIEKICEELDVRIEDSVVIGDTEADVCMGYDAGAGLTVGVLSGIGTRLDLAQYSDYVVDDIEQAVSRILPPEADCVAVHTPLVRRLRASYNQKTAAASLVIFDKDGTLLCFHSMWTPWAKDLVNRLEKETGLRLHDDIMTELGFCETRQKWTPGVLAEGTQDMNKERVKAVLQTNGVEEDTASHLVENAWQDGNQSESNSNLTLLDNPTALFRTLHEQGVKVAICTADSRAGTLQFVKSIGAEEYIDLIVCGDDPMTEPKPSPLNAAEICRTLGVSPSRAVVVGDTIADMDMGKRAGLGATVAVLSGVGGVEDLQGSADHVVPSIKHILPVIFKNGGSGRGSGAGNMPIL